jgi:hypothetical protein
VDWSLIDQQTMKEWFESIISIKHKVFASEPKSGRSMTIRVDRSGEDRAA